MRKVLVSLMCHPERTTKIQIPSGDDYEAFVNRTPNYADAYRFAIGKAVDGEMDLVTADTDGYHPPAEIIKLATGTFYQVEPALVLPFRENIGFQSKSFSLLFSLVERKRIRDATGGLCRLSHELLRALPPLMSEDMTVHIEILKHSVASGAKIIQYPYSSDANDEAESRRTRNYQWKLLKALLK
jgi:hypothetical protein